MTGDEIVALSKKHTITEYLPQRGRRCSQTATGPGTARIFTAQVPLIVPMHAVNLQPTGLRQIANRGH